MATRREQLIHWINRLLDVCDKIGSDNGIDTTSIHLARNIPSFENFAIAKVFEIDKEFNADIQAGKNDVLSKMFTHFQAQNNIKGNEDIIQKITVLLTTNQKVKELVINHWKVIHTIVAAC